MEVIPLPVWMEGGLHVWMEGWLECCMFFIEFVPGKGGQFYTMGESVVVMAEEHRVSPVQGVTVV